MVYANSIAKCLHDVCAIQFMFYKFNFTILFTFDFNFVQRKVIAEFCFYPPISLGGKISQTHRVFAFGAHRTAIRGNEKVHCCRNWIRILDQRFYFYIFFFFIFVFVVANVYMKCARIHSMYYNICNRNQFSTSFVEVVKVLASHSIDSRRRGCRQQCTSLVWHGGTVEGVHHVNSIEAKNAPKTSSDSTSQPIKNGCVGF